ncbi:putative bifunctional diguanylate cyclase/phosphodiesterase [Humidesulfovibrio sp.]
MCRAEDGPEVVNILAVDDEQVNLLLLSGLLRREGVSIITARSGYDALKLIHQHDFALILLDVMMPGMDGFTTAERIRDDECTRHIPIIFITAISKEQRHVFKGYESGAVDYLIKPFEHEILKNKVRVFVDMHRQRLAVQRASEALAKTVDELRSSSRALSDSRARYQNLFTSMFNGFALLGCGAGADLREARILEMNPAMEQIMGRPRELLADRALGEVLPNMESYLRDFAAEVTRSGKSGLLESYLSDIKRWLRIQAYVPGPGLLALVAEDITARRMAEETIQERTFQDPLTGLANRALFLNRLEQSMERSRRRLNYLYAVLFLDLDRFKPINSSLGHAAGDKVLCDVAARIVNVARGLDTVARIGGDEFAIILEELKSPGEALAIARRIRHEMSKPMELNGHALHFTASVGVVLGPADYAQPEELLQDAGIAMEHARTLGGGKVKVFKWAMRTRAQYALNVNQSLHHALDREQFRLHYQPIFSLKDNTLAGFEALIRWKVDGRLIPPADFIPHAEQTGLIVPIGQWALAEACRQASQWEQRFALPKDFTMAVNLSAKQFTQPDLVRQLARVLEDNNLSPQRLKLEITETMVMQNPESVVHRLRGLREMGVLVSIDDFGTGYSSLSYLRRFPLTTLKVDRSFVSDLNAFENLIIVRTIVSLAHNLGFDVVAEGIETESQRDFLASLGCEYGQGFLFSRPLAADKALELLAVCGPRHAAGA